jgi:hypothetical protein
MWARIESGVVREMTEINPSGRFHPSLVWEPCESDVREGWTYDGSSFAAPQAVNPAVSLADYQRAVEAHVVATAQTRGYYSDVSLASYLGSTNAAWAAEAAAFVAWRDDVWETTLAALAAWQSGGDAPTIAGLIAELPAIAWP